MLIKNKQINIILIFFILLLISPNLKGQGNSDYNSIKTVVIDAGHGGRDPGALSKDKKVKEKDITLSVAVKLGNLIKLNYPNIKVVYTRKTDVYVNLSERANIANKNKADLFISIHVNANKLTQPRGTETFVMGESKSDDNFDVCKAENSVIIIEDDYQHRYEGFDPNSPESYIIFSLIQNTHKEQSLRFADCVQKEFAKGPIRVNRGVKQGGLLVLWKTTMPAVLTEIGFISNKNDCQILVTKEGQNKVANNLYNAFLSYKNYVEGEDDVERIGVDEIDEKGEELILSGSKNDIKVVDKKIEKKDDKVQKNDVKKGVEGNVKRDVKNNTTYNGIKKEKVDVDFYAIQILSVNKVLKPNAFDLKGYKDAKYLKIDNLYKYYLGDYKSFNEAYKDLKKIREVFKGAFIIHIKNGKKLNN